MSKELLHHYQVWSSLDKDQRPAFVDYLKTVGPWLFSHHPHNACFREHVWKVNGFYLCKGCVMTSIGFLAGLAVQLGTGWISLLPEELVGLCFVALLLPTIGTSLLDAPRSLKHLARFLLGVLIASALLLIIVTGSWAVRAVVIVTYVITKSVFGKVREAQNESLIKRCA